MYCILHNLKQVSTVDLSVLVNHTTSSSSGLSTRSSAYSPLEHRDFLSIDDQLAAIVTDLAMVTAVGGVILEHVDLRSGYEANKNKCEEQLVKMSILYVIKDTITGMYT